MTSIQKNNTPLSILDFGASPASPNNTKAIAEAIEACSNAGGGQVVVPRGVFMTGSVELLSNVNLHLEEDACLEGINHQDAYRAIEKKPLPGCPQDARNRYPKKAKVMIWARNAKNISLTGKGRILGPTPTGDVDHPLRPSIVSIINCDTVYIAGISIENSTFWSLHLLNSRNIVVEDCRVDTPLDRINGDGIDPDGCVNVRISRCRVTTGDDAICIKTSEGSHAENILVEDCVLQSGCAAAIKFGTESIGDIRGVTIRRCEVQHSHWGIMFYAKDGGAYKDIKIHDCTLETWGMMSLLIDITPRFYQSPVYGSIDNLEIANCTFKGPGKALFQGQQGHPIRNLRLKDIKLDPFGEVPENEIRKPNGAGLVDIDPNAPNYAALQSHWVGVQIDGAQFSNINFKDPKAKPTLTLIKCKEVDTDSSICPNNVTTF